MNSTAANLPDAVTDLVPDDLPFDDSALDKLKGSYALRAMDDADALAWCGCCTTVSRSGDWATGGGGGCPQCREPIYARFLWSDLRRIKPRLPEAALVGQAIAVYEY